MRLVFQRVRSASVSVGDQVAGSIEAGAVLLLGIASHDRAEDAAYLAGKVSRLRVFDDADGRMNRSIEAVGGAFLVISQFTLYGDCRKGNRPSYIQAAAPDEARELYETFIRELEACGHRVETGRFQEHMVVSLENDGPVTIWLDSDPRTRD